MVSGNGRRPLAPINYGPRWRSSKRFARRLKLPRPEGEEHSIPQSFDGYGLLSRGRRTTAPRHVRGSAPGLSSNFPDLSKPPVVHILRSF